MPCSKGMRNCRLDCSHRRFVRDYQAEVQQQDIRAEEATGNYGTEIAEYFGSTGRGVEERWTFKRYLQTYARDDYPYPRADKEEADDADEPERMGAVGATADS